MRFTSSGQTMTAFFNAECRMQNAELRSTRALKFIFRPLMQYYLKMNNTKLYAVDFCFDFIINNLIFYTSCIAVAEL